MPSAARASARDTLSGPVVSGAVHPVPLLRMHRAGVNRAALSF